MKNNIFSHSAVNCKDFREFFKDIKLDTIVEIGTHKGMSAIYIAKFANKIYTFDIEDYPEKYKIWKNAEVENRVFYYTIKNRQDIKNVLDKIEFDFAFIDGEHTYEAVKADFELVKHCGRVLFHDIHIEGIKKFVEEIGATEIKTIAYWTK